MSLGQLVRDGARMGQHVAFVELQEGVKTLHPFGHVHRRLAPRLVFGKVEVHGHHAVQFRDLRLRQVVFGNCGIGFADGAVRRVLPLGQAHVGFHGVGTALDDLRGGVAVDGEVQLVLDRGKEGLAERVRRAQSMLLA